MKRIIILLLTVVSFCGLQAGITTYTFKAENWTSNPADGWVSDKDGESFESTYQKGVKVTANYSGAGATSVNTFTNVRRITLNYATTTKGAGSFRIQVGENTPIDTTVTVTTSNKDMTIVLPASQTGKIKFTVNCSKNSIWLYQVIIRSEDGVSPAFTQDMFKLVTSVGQLQDSDQIIIGVHKEGVNKIMGYFDEDVSQNNIHAINGKYSADRTTVEANDYAIYTLRTAPEKGKSAYYIQDELRYELAYLVASGGQTKNRLALWTSLVDDKTYGDYGYWNISIAADGAATIQNLGNSLGKYLQYNATNNPTLFGCYPTENSQTPVAIYRLTKATGDVPAIVAPMANFGMVILDQAELTGSKTIEVNANKLTQDITASFKHGDIFSLGASTLDRDGDNLTISYKATAAGKYIDTLVLVSGEVKTEATVMLNVVKLHSIAEVVKMPDYTMVYLNEVEVTKRYDKYVFVRDATGSLLIWDNGNAYGKDLKSGYKLTGVCGRYQNYFGVPELAPTAQWTVTKGDEAVPEEETVPIDSADVCRFVRLKNITITDGKIAGTSLPVIDAFNTGIQEGKCDILDAMVMISWDQVELWIVKQTNNSTPPDPAWKVTLVQPEHGTISCQEDIILDQVIDKTTLHFTAFPDENYELDYWIGCNADGTVTVTKDITVSCAFKEIIQTGLVESHQAAVESSKVLRDGQLFVRRNGHLYTITGINVQ